MSKPFSLNQSDIVKSIVVAVLVAFLGGLQQMVAAHGFDFVNYDWGFILNLSGTALVGYLSKNFLQDESGMIAGRIG